MTTDSSSVPTAAPSTHETGTSGSFWRRFLALFAVGVVGVVALAPTVRPMVDELAAAPEMRDTGIPAELLLLLTLLQPIVLLAGATAVGVLLAHRIGLRSRIADAAVSTPGAWTGFRRDLGLGVVAGAFVSVVTVALDLAIQPLMSPEWQRVLAEAERGAMLTIAGVLYGGITEELLTRWGLMTMLAWIPWRMLDRGPAPPGAAIMWGAVIVSALLFGVGHLQAAAALLPLDQTIIARTIALNALAGIVFGLMYWRRSLEGAMIAHGSAHLVLTLVTIVAPGVPGA